MRFEERGSKWQFLSSHVARRAGQAYDMVKVWDEVTVAILHTANKGNVSLLLLSKNS